LKGDFPQEKKRGNTGKRQERSDKERKNKTQKQTTTPTKTQQHFHKNPQTPSLSNPIIN